MAGGGADSRVVRRALIEKLWQDGHLRSARVAEAMQAVPRELFVPGLPLEEVYRASEAIVVKRLDGVSVSSASAPEVVALMLEQLDVRPGQRVLEIGAGTGYNAALLAYMVGDGGQVVTLDIDEDLVLAARDHLRDAGYGQVSVVQSDGALGYPYVEAYDRIILTVASSDIAPAWREQLARPDGRLVLPLGLRGLQRSVAFSPAVDGEYLVSDSVRNCSFIPLRGVLAPGALRVPLDPEGARVLTGDEGPLPLELDEISRLLRAPAHAVASGVWSTVEELRDGLHLWLATHQPGVYTLWGGSRLRDLFGLPDAGGTRGTLCVMDSRGLVFLAWEADDQRAGEFLLMTPAGGDALADRMQRLLTEWDTSGRPRDADLEIRAYPRARGVEIEEGDVVVDQRWSRFVLNWKRAAQPPAIFTV